MSVSPEDLSQMATQLRAEMQAQGAEALRYVDRNIKAGVDLELAPMRLEFDSWKDVVRNDRDQFRGEINVSQMRFHQDVEKFYKEFESQKVEVTNFYREYVQRCSAIEQYVVTMEGHQNVPADVMQAMATFNSGMATMKAEMDVNFAGYIIGKC